MEIKSEDIKVIIAANGMIYIGEEEKDPQEQPEEFNDSGMLIGKLGSWNKMRLKHPFRLVPVEGGVAFTSIVLKEKWALIDLCGSVEVELHPQIEDLYRKYCEQEFCSGIIMPESKRVII